MRQLRALSVLMFAWAWPASAADKLPPVDAEFLEYLGSFGGDEEDWTLFADDEEPPGKAPPAKDAAAKEPAGKRDGSKTEAAANPAEKR
ncbi:MAG TPA: hypothetical protein VJQ52_06210 [Steroidobacteraceae bacterium]|nr:hypothetical protein [Steroidobacteraceae bacterium]